MSPGAPSLRVSQAAKRLGVSIKTLRLYEQHGLLTPARTAAGYRVYGPDEMARAAEIVSLRALGLGLVQVSRVLAGDPRSVELALASHESTLEAQIHKLGTAINRVRVLRAEIARGHTPVSEELTALLRPRARFDVAFDLPWPWGGERFELRDVGALNYIVGPVGSGKTRLAQRLAEVMPGGAFLGLDRLETATAPLIANPDLKLRIDRRLAWLVDEGAKVSDALTALLIGLEAEGPAILVIDMVEQGLDEATQRALMIDLRQRAKADSRPLMLMTRSTAILDLHEVGADEMIIFCAANHSSPVRVAACPGSPGYEALASCLASPEVRARTAGVLRRADSVSFPSST